MDEQQAKKILVDIGYHQFFDESWEKGKVVKLDGDYTIDELKTFAWVMENIPEIVFNEENYNKWLVQLRM